MRPVIAMLAGYERVASEQKKRIFVTLKSHSHPGFTPTHTLLFYFADSKIIVYDSCLLKKVCLALLLQAVESAT